MSNREQLKKILKTQALREQWRWAESCHAAILGLCVLKIAASCGLLAVTLATRGLIDAAVGHDGARGLRYAGLLAAAFCVSWGSGLLADLLNAKTNAGLLRALRTHLLEAAMEKRYDSLDGLHSGELVNLLFSDVAVVKTGFLEILPDIAGMTVSFVGAAVILLRMDWRFVALLVAGGLLGLALIAALQRPMKSRHRAAQKAEDGLHAAVQEIFGNLRLIKASCSEARLLRRAQDRQQAYLDALCRKGTFAAGANHLIQVMFQCSWMLCMLWGCYGIYRGRLTYGMLAAIIQLVGLIQGPISGAAGIAGKSCAALSSAERLHDLLALPREEDVRGAVRYQDLTEIRLQGVEFAYPREKTPVFRAAELCIRPGEFAAVTGPSGSGKSTLFQLLLGIYQPGGGSLRFCFADGTQEPASRKTRALFAYVPQGNTLFSGTLRENLTMFTDSATDEEIWQAARTACIDGFLSGLADGLDTVIGERGIGLSEGQAQRVAVARALLSQAPILLLDESTSALDAATEAALLRNLAALPGRTCLIVTHRPAALRYCGYRIELEEGRLRKTALPNSRVGKT